MISSSDASDKEESFHDTVTTALSAYENFYHPSASGDFVTRSDQITFRLIQNAIEEGDNSFLRKQVLNPRGLISNELRRRAWPLIAPCAKRANSLSPFKISDTCKEQIWIDVERTHSRISNYLQCTSSDIDEEEFKTSLNLLIVSVLNRHPELHYYQGYHDICLTFVLVYTSAKCVDLVDVITCDKLFDYMAPTMNDTMEILKYLFPLINELSSDLAEHIHRSGTGVVFAISWLITWFSHVVHNPHVVNRLFDAFIVCDKTMPLYVAAAVVAHNSKFVLGQQCDMAEMHHILSKLPRDMTASTVEEILINANKLIQRNPPSELIKIWDRWVLKCASMEQLVDDQRGLEMSSHRVPILGRFYYSNGWISKITTLSIGVAAASIIMYREFQRNPQILESLFSVLYRGAE